eukprot:4003752-Amphidinium_carterae.1
MKLHLLISTCPLLGVFGTMEGTRRFGTQRWRPSALQACVMPLLLRCHLAEWPTPLGWRSSSANHLGQLYSSSAVEQKTAIELQRLVDQGAVKVFASWEAVFARWPKDVATRVATIVKEPPAKKMRIILDMLRPGVNALASASELIVLPCGTDLVSDVLHVWTHSSKGEAVELFSPDFADAFLSLPLHGHERDPLALLGASAFALGACSFATTSLVWGRFASWIVRLTAAVLAALGQHRLQVYVDVPVITPVGSETCRTQMSAMILLLAALGAQLLWIGIVFGVHTQGEVQTTLDSQHLERPPGELSWVAGVVPRLRPFAAVAELDRARTADTGTAARTAARCLMVQHTSAVVVTSLFCSTRQRRYVVSLLPSSIVIRTDASTQGLAGVLFDQQGLLVRCWFDKIQAENLARFGVKAAEPALMPEFEMLALFLWLKVWQTQLAEVHTGWLVQMLVATHIRDVANVGADALSRGTRLAAGRKWLDQPGILKQPASSRKCKDWLVGDRLTSSTRLAHAARLQLGTNLRIVHYPDNITVEDALTILYIYIVAAVRDAGYRTAHVCMAVASACLHGDKPVSNEWRRALNTARK